MLLDLSQWQIHIYWLYTTCQAISCHCTYPRRIKGIVSYQTGHGWAWWGYRAMCLEVEPLDFSMCVGGRDFRCTGETSNISGRNAWGGLGSWLHMLSSLTHSDTWGGEHLLLRKGYRFIVMFYEWWWQVKWTILTSASGVSDRMR